MALTADPLVDGIPFNFFFLEKLVAYCIIKLIICSIVIRYNGAQLLYNPVVLKHWKESILLLVPTIRGYRTKAKKGVYKLFLAINKMAANREEKVII